MEGLLNTIPNYKDTDETGASLDHNTSWKIMLWAKENNISFETFWAWARQKDASIDRLQAYNNAWIRGGHSPGLYFIQRILERFYPNLTRDRNTEKFIKSFELPNVTYSTDYWLKPEDLKSDNKFVMLSGSMGTNKTGSVIQSLNPSDTILWLTPRITLTHNTLGRLDTDGRFEFKNYKDWGAPDKRHEIPQFQHLLCCVPSLWKTGDKTYDTVVIDEIETLLVMWKGGKDTPGAKDINMNWMRFKDIIRGAKKVYIMDAFMNDRTYKLCQLIDPAGTFKTIQNPTPPPERHFVKYKNKNAWLSRLIQQLKDGRNVFVFYPYKTTTKFNQGMEEIAIMLSKETGIPITDFIWYNADVGAKIKSTTQEVNKVWSSKRCIITNTSITVGVNFDNQHVDSIFALYPTWASQRDFFQALYRCRHIKTNEINLVVEGRAQKQPWIHADVKCPIYTQLISDLKYEFNTAGDKDVFKFFANHANIKFRGDIQEISDDVSKNITKMIEESECLYRWDMIKDIDCFEQYEQLIIQTINNWTNDANTGLQIRKYLFKQLFAVHTPDVEMKELWELHKFKLIEGINTIFDGDRRFWAPEDKLVKSIFEQNGALDTLELPKHPKWDYDIEEVKRHFETRVVNERAQHNSTLIQNVLKAYFGVDAICSIKERSHVAGDHCRKLTDYKMNPIFVSTTNTLVKYLRNTQPVPDAFFENTDYPEDFKPIKLTIEQIRSMGFDDEDDFDIGQMESPTSRARLEDIGVCFEDV